MNRWILYRELTQPVTDAVISLEELKESCLLLTIICSQNPYLEPSQISTMEFFCEKDKYFFSFKQYKQKMHLKLKSGSHFSKKIFLFASMIALQK